MKKEVVYSLRMSRTIRDALQKAAREESRSVASLLDKIITDFLARKGLLSHLDAVKDQRWFTRKEIYQPAHIYFQSDSRTEKVGIVVLNISMGGVLIGYPKQAEIAFSPEDNSDFELCIDLSDTEKTVCFRCKPKRMVDSGYGIRLAANFVESDPNDLQLLRSYLN